MIASELLDILVCPETKQPLELLEGAKVDELNDRIRSGVVVNRSGAAVGEPVQGLLLREDGAFAYPIREGIPVMLVDEAIAMSR
ncbi:MAG: Trm112 family protein [Bdellovibrionales bacterium]|nr:Trm112 family protein [Bdellovibrionales bacterium]